ncbi:hypothetical protein PUN4_520198 [Paraburkholderia unamae]|nr:hypothetical protein PUN4_520198 [Paraburkholderia unamae]
MARTAHSPVASGSGALYDCL